MAIRVNSICGWKIIMVTGKLQFCGTEKRHFLLKRQHLKRWQTGGRARRWSDRHGEVQRRVNIDKQHRQHTQASSRRLKVPKRRRILLFEWPVIAWLCKEFKQSNDHSRSASQLGESGRQERNVASLLALRIQATNPRKKPNRKAIVLFTFLFYAIRLNWNRIQTERKVNSKRNSKPNSNQFKNRERVERTHH